MEKPKEAAPAPKAEVAPVAKPKEEAKEMGKPEAVAKPEVKPAPLGLSGLRLQFAFDDYNLSTQSKENLDKVASWMKKDPNARIRSRGIPVILEPPNITWRWGIDGRTALKNIWKCWEWSRPDSPPSAMERKGPQSLTPTKPTVP